MQTKVIFYGWCREEINIKPWTSLLTELKEGNNRTKWIDRIPYAYWKGNAFSGSKSRVDLLSCNVSDKQDWNARIYNLVIIFLKFLVILFLKWPVGCAVIVIIL